jgi:hypothetical protein
VIEQAAGLVSVRGEARLMVPPDSAVITTTLSTTMGSRAAAVQAAASRAAFYQHLSASSRPDRDDAELATEIKAHCLAELSGGCHPSGSGHGRQRRAELLDKLGPQHLRADGAARPGMACWPR